MKVCGFLSLLATISVFLAAPGTADAAPRAPRGCLLTNTRSMAQQAREKVPSYLVPIRELILPRWQAIGHTPESGLELLDLLSTPPDKLGKTIRSLDREQRRELTLRLLELTELAADWSHFGIREQLTDLIIKAFSELRDLPPEERASLLREPNLWPEDPSPGFQRVQNKLIDALAGIDYAKTETDAFNEALRAKYGPEAPQITEWRNGGVIFAPKKISYTEFIEMCQKAIQERYPDKETYHAFPGRYGDGADLMTPYTELEEIAVKLTHKRVTRFVDLGSGWGRTGIVFGIRHPGVEFEGIELVSNRVNQAKRSAQALGLANVRFTEADVGSRDFSPPAADTYFMYDPVSQEDLGILLRKLRAVNAGRPFKIVAREGRGRFHSWLGEVSWLKKLDTKFRNRKTVVFEAEASDPYTDPRTPED